MRALILFMVLAVAGCSDPFGLQAAFGTPTHRSGPPPAHKTTYVDVEIYKDGALIDTLKSISLKNALRTERLAKTAQTYCPTKVRGPDCVAGPVKVVIYGE
ncbi:MAG: hypothetical protein AAGI03_00520 [Pseudomonadota bacterium]